MTVESRALPLLSTGLSVPFAVTGVALVTARIRAEFTLPCVLRDHIGVPCPFCGVTRAASALLRFDVSPHQLAGVGVVLAIAVMSLVCLVTWFRRRALPTPVASATYLAGVSGLLLANWVVQLTS